MKREELLFAEFEIHDDFKNPFVISSRYHAVEDELIQVKVSINNSKIQCSICFSNNIGNNPYEMEIDRYGNIDTSKCSSMQIRKCKRIVGMIKSTLIVYYETIGTLDNEVLLQSVTNRIKSEIKEIAEHEKFRDTGNIKFDELRAFRIKGCTKYVARYNNEGDTVTVSQNDELARISIKHSNGETDKIEIRDRNRLYELIKNGDSIAVYLAEFSSLNIINNSKLRRNMQ